jgi:ubiquitin-like protein ATG12
VFCYVNSVFAPGLDEGVGNLWRVSFFFFCRCSFSATSYSCLGWFCFGEVFLLTFLMQCFKTGEELVVSYSVTQAFG